ncbi:MAG: deoxyribonuclease IV [Isosphaeraceae bacterium]|nr:deoxyribonuclease IV [Isosphaeraceae bacterium]
MVRSTKRAKTAAEPMRDPLILGAHMSIAGGLSKAADAAVGLGMETVQIFTQSPSRWSVPPVTAAAPVVRSKSVEPEEFARFREAAARGGLVTTIAHNSYLVNLAAPDEALRRRSIEAMCLEIEKCEALGIADLVVHPGAHMGEGEEVGLERVASALDEIHRRTEGVRLRVALETTAGQGTTLGARFEHLQRILESVSAPERLSVCVDTCHIFAAGYSLGTRAEYDETIGALERAVGKGRVRVWHVNDSLREQGSRVDRHAGIGRGHLGLDPFRLLVNDPRFRGIPLILETPKGLDESGEDLDAINLRILRGLVE